jgi:CubicO group peptidase (beta-lactamase class C family)
MVTEPQQVVDPSGLMRESPPPPEALVTLANWQDPPFNRWGFQHVRDLVPTARIGRGDGPVAEFERAPRELDSIGVPGADGGAVSLADALAQTYTDGFLVLHDGRIVDERYFTGMTPATPHLLMSVSKSVTGALAGVLTGRGQLDPAAPVVRYVPELAGTSFEGATVRHLLDMRTGTRFNEDYADLASHARQYEQIAGWRPLVDPQPAADLYGYMATLENDRPHGGMFEYRSILSDLLAWVLERAGGDRFPDLLSREVWAPLGPEHDADITVDPHGFSVADGGINTTLRDLARFGQLYLQGGVWGGHQVVPAGWIEDTRHGDDDTRAAFAASQHAGEFPGGMYRNQWWILLPDGSRYTGLGINGQMLFVDVPANVVVAKFSTWPVALDDELEMLQVKAAIAVAEALGPPT